MKRFGLIGKTLSYSFSKNYFDNKFKNENIKDCSYDLFELADISEFPKLIEQLGDSFSGMNVTIPYKKEVIPYLDGLNPIAEKIGAVNVIKKENGKLIGYNSDYFGFKTALENWLENTKLSALILGTGGASDAISTVLASLDIPYQFISRTKGINKVAYKELNKSLIASNKLIINTTPLGTFPAIALKPEIPYEYLTESHYLFDLVYNPEETSFLKAGKTNDAKIKNGLEMLEQQAEEAWRIWQY